MEESGVFFSPRRMSCKKSPRRLNILPVLKEARSSNFYSNSNAEKDETSCVFNDPRRHRYARSQNNFCFAGHRDEATVEGEISLGNEEPEKMPYCGCRGLIKVGDPPIKKTWMANRVAKQKLQLDLDVLSRRYKSHWSKIKNVVRDIEERIELLEEDLKKPSAVSKDQFLTEVKPEVTFTPLEWDSKRWKYLCKKSKCLQFPCIKPENYHTIGFRPELHDNKWIPWEELQHMYDDEEAFEKSSILRSTKSPLRFNISSREENLKKTWIAKISENDKSKPEPWEINYGKPTPVNLLKYPVRLIPNLSACPRFYY